MSEPRDTSERVIDWRNATPEEQAAFWRRVEEAGCLIAVDPGVAQYASVTVMLPPVRVGVASHVVVFEDGKPVSLGEHGARLVEE